MISRFIGISAPRALHIGKQYKSYIVLGECFIGQKCLRAAIAARFSLESLGYIC